MAIASTCVWEVRTTGAQHGGGFFKPGATGNDYSQQNAPQYSLTGGSAAGVGATISHASAAADMVGNGLKIVSGTNATQQWFEVISVVVGVSITVDRNCTSGASANIAFNVGGAVALGFSTDSTMMGTMQAGNKMWIKAGTYTLSTTLNYSGVAGSATALVVVEGYNSARGDKPKASTRPLITGGVVLSGTLMSYESLQFSHNSGTLFSAGTRNRFSYCKFTNSAAAANQIALSTATYDVVQFCEITSTNGYAIQHGNALQVIGCWIRDSVIGIRNTSGSNNYSDTYWNNIISGCSTAAIAFTSTKDTPAHIFGNTIYGTEAKAGIGISMASGMGGVYAIGNIFYGLTTGFSVADASGALASANFYDDFNNYYNNTTDVSNVTKGANDTAVDPQFTNAASGNFAIGRNLGALGPLGLFPGGLTTGYMDIGAAQRLVGTPSAGDLRLGVSVEGITGTMIAAAKATTKHGVTADDGTGEYRGADLWDSYTADQLKHGITKNIDGVPTLGTYRADDLWTAFVPNQIKAGESGLQDGSTVNGTYAPTCDYPEEGDVRYNIVYDNGGRTGTLGAPVPGDELLTIAHDALIDRVIAVLDDDTFARIPNPYNLERNKEGLLRKGYGVKIGPAKNVMNVHCNYQVDRTMTVVISREAVHTDNNADGFASTTKQLCEDVANIVRDLETNTTLNTGAIFAGYPGDGGVQLLNPDQAIMYIEMDVVIRLVSTLN